MMWQDCGHHNCSLSSPAGPAPLCAQLTARDLLQKKCVGSEVCFCLPRGRPGHLHSCFHQPSGHISPNHCWPVLPRAPWEPVRCAGREVPLEEQAKAMSREQGVGRQDPSQVHETTPLTNLCSKHVLSSSVCAQHWPQTSQTGLQKTDKTEKKATRMRRMGSNLSAQKQRDAFVKHATAVF